jgi:hypothetical protein
LKSSVGVSKPIAFWTCSAVSFPLAALGFVILAHQAGAAVERILVHFDDAHRNTGR